MAGDVPTGTVGRDDDPFPADLVQGGQFLAERPHGYEVEVLDAGVLPVAVELFLLTVVALLGSVKKIAVAVSE